MNLNNKNYEIIINADTKITCLKSILVNIYKNYNSTAFTTIITHSKLSNKIAEQYFTILDLWHFCQFQIIKHQLYFLYMIKFNKK